jgi:hypothetical protein
MNLEIFSKVSESLRQYRRAELKDFESEIGEKPVDQLYVDALPGGAVLQAVLSSNTTRPQHNSNLIVKNLIT